MSTVNVNERIETEMIQAGYAQGSYDPAPATPPETWSQYGGGGAGTVARFIGEGRIYRCSPHEQMHRWTCKHEKTCECGEVTRVFVPDGL